MSKNKEWGSDFYYLSGAEYKLQIGSESSDTKFDYLYFSGRAAFRAIILNGLQQFGWKKIYVPSYYCHEVYGFVADLDIDLEFYSANPFLNEVPNTIKDEKEMVILLVNYFGLGSPNYGHLKNIFTIEDVTHNLEVINKSTAHFVFGSLRKTLPLPVGGFLQSKIKHEDVKSSFAAENVALEKLSGMYLKKAYLEGKVQNKEFYRNLLSEAEKSFADISTFGSMPRFVVDYLCSLNVTQTIEAKRLNSAKLKKLLRKSSYFDVVSAEDNSEFALVLKFVDKSSRDDLRERLISKSIFPIILWPNQIIPDDQLVEDTILLLHIDFRYGDDDLKVIANTINDADI